MMKKRISIVMTLVMALTIFVIPTGAAYAEEDEGALNAAGDMVDPEGEAVVEEDGVLDAMEGELPSPENLKADESSITENSIKFVWDQVDGAAGYTYSIDGATWKDTTDLYCDNPGLSPGTEYTIHVKAFKGTGDERVEGTEATASATTKEAAPVYTAPAATTITGATPSYTSIKFTWAAVSGADGYAFSRGISNAYRDIGTATSYEWTGLEERTEYTFYVWAYKVVPKGTDGSVMINPREGTSEARKCVLLSPIASKVAKTKSSEYMTRKKKSRGYVYKYYNAAYGSGDLGTSYTMWNKVKNAKSKTKYLIAIDTKRNNVVIYKGKKGHWKVYKHVICSCGMPSHTTPHGTFKIFKRKPKFAGFVKRNGHVTKEKYTCWYATRFKGACFFHSTLYKFNSKSAHADRKLGDNRSHGCIRMNISDARWIYRNCKNGTTVISSSCPRDTSFGKWDWK